jgi:hypothetical protein
MINRVGKMCVAVMSLCMIVLIVTRKKTLHINILLHTISQNISILLKRRSLKLACIPIFQKINTLCEKASIEVEGKHVMSLCMIVLIVTRKKRRW